VPRTVYIAKVQAFLAIKNHRRVRIITERRQGGQADQSVEDEICLIRYYCRVGAASINAVDRVRNCVKLRWSMREVKEAADRGPPTVDDELPSVANVATRVPTRSTSYTQFDFFKGTNKGGKQLEGLAYAETRCNWSREPILAALGGVQRLAWAGI
jgi:hypothetical protein